MMPRKRTMREHRGEAERGGEGTQPRHEPQRDTRDETESEAEAEDGDEEEDTSNVLASHSNQVFVSQFSADGSKLVSACQDKRIRLFDSVSWRVEKEIVARDVGWSVIDSDFSPDQRFLIYSSWSDSIHLCNLTDALSDTHHALNLQYVVMVCVCVCVCVYVCVVVVFMCVCVCVCVCV
jgi:WD domain, G-beta repeat